MKFDFRDIKEFLKDTFKFIAVIIIVLLIAIYIVGLQTVAGPSMKPTLNNGDVVIVNKLIYKLTGLRRNDIVSLNNSDEKYLIKRIIGLPGEKIQFINNVLYINYKPYEETFLDENITTQDFNINSLGYNIIPKDKYLVLGDNREDSMDSRQIGLIDKKDITGRIFIKFLPIKEIKIVR